MKPGDIKYFEVNEHGIIRSPDFYEPKKREDVYNLSLEYDVATPASLISFAEYCPPLQWEIGSHYTEYREDPAYPDRLKSMPEEPEEGWTDWVLGMDKKTFSSLRKGIKIWLSEEPDWSQEEDYIDYRETNEGAVFDFFENEPGDVLDALGVEIIEGPYPGNNSRDAELCRPIEEANAIAERMGLDYRFRKMTEEYSREKDEIKQGILPIREAIFVLIPAGTFMMGSPENETLRKRNGDENLHEVTISKPFYLQTTPVTQWQWQKVMGGNPSHFAGNDNLPVESVSWNDVRKFIRMINSQEGANKYRLPTEAEWEYACRAGSTTEYFFGDDPVDLHEYAWISERSTHPVGQKMPNAWGLYDMYGNVWEWVKDWYGKYKSSSVTDPKGPSSGSRRVVRGGSWYSAAATHRSAYRGNIEPDKSEKTGGFRLLRTR